MTVRYVGPGGSDAANGLTWATRKLTLNGAEDSPVVAGDIVYVAPGVYREMLTVDVSGTAGNQISYIADVTGAYTDSVGGVVRVTGSDDDIAATRTNAISGTTRSYRTFHGFTFDGISGGNSHISIGSASNWNIEECVFQPGGYGVFVSGAATAISIKRCVFFSMSSAGVRFYNATAVDNSAHLIENCLFLGGGFCIRAEVFGNWTIRNNTFFGGGYGLFQGAAPNAGQTIIVNNNIFTGHTNYALSSTTAGFVVEDYNAFFANAADRSNVAVGANSINHILQFEAPLIATRAPWNFGALSEWSTLRKRTGSSPASSDLNNIIRPTLNAKVSWGAVQFVDVSLSTTQFRGASGASLKLADAGRTRFVVPVNNVSTTISVYVYREADYAGTNPAMAVYQEGHTAVSAIDSGIAGQWNLLTITLTPDATPGYVTVELISFNDATSGNFACYFDDLAVS